MTPEDDVTGWFSQELNELRKRVEALEEFRAEYQNMRWRARRLVTILRDANDAVSVMDFEGRILEWNPAAERMYGDTESEARTMNVSQLIPAEHHAQERQRLTQLREGTRLAPDETQRVTKSGSFLSIVLTITALAGEAGDRDGVSSSERDVTERKQLADAEDAFVDAINAQQASECRMLGLKREELGRPQPYPVSD